MLLKYVVAFIAGLLVPFSLSPFHYSFLAIISIILLLCCLDKTSVKQAIKLGYLYGLGSFGYGVSWIYISIHEHGHASPLLAGLLTTILICGLLAFYPAIKLGTIRYIDKNHRKETTKVSNTAFIVSFASVWVIIDWIQAWLFTGFPWLYLGYSQTDTILASYAPIVSVFGLTWLIIVVASLIYLLIKNIFLFCKNSKNQYIINQSLNYLLILVSIYIFASSLSTVEWTIQSKDTENLVLVQGNIPQENRWNLQLFKNNTQIYENLTDPYWQNSTIVWPEGAISLPLPYSQELITRWQKQAFDNNSTLILGIPSLANQQQQFFNSIIALGKGEGIHNKNKLVPWGEYVPLENIFRGLISFFDLPMSNFISGAVQSPHFNILNSTFIKWLPFICYEIAYPDYVISHAKNGNAIITISNDAWFGDSIGPWQHLQLAQMRALETGKPVVRSTNNGVTAIINQHGEITSQIPQFKAEVLTDKIYGFTGSTPITYYGVNFIILLCCLLIIVTSNLTQVIQNRRR